MKPLGEGAVGRLPIGSLNADRIEADRPEIDVVVERELELAVDLPHPALLHREFGELQAALGGGGAAGTEVGGE